MSNYIGKKLCLTIRLEISVICCKFILSLLFECRYILYLTQISFQSCNFSGTLSLNNEVKLRHKFHSAEIHYLINRYKALMRTLCGRNNLSTELESRVSSKRLDVLLRGE